MDEKQTKSQKEPTVLGTVKILVLSDGNVSVIGPVNNPVIMLNIFGRAMAAVANHIAESEEKKRVVPEAPIVTMN